MLNPAINKTALATNQMKKYGTIVSMSIINVHSLELYPTLQMEKENM